MAQAHGNYTTYGDGCRCTPCRRDATRTRKIHRLGRSLKVDGDKVRAHIAQLCEAGMSVSDIAEDARMYRRNLGRIIDGTYRDVNRPTAERLFAVQPRAGWALLDATGSRRRYQALTAIGWSGKEILQRLQDIAGYTTNTTRINTQRHISARLAGAIRRVYDDLSMTVPPDTVTARRARARAARYGWAPPLAWDEDTIDDPEAEPDIDGPARTSQLRHLAEESDWLQSQGISLDEAAQQLGITRGYLDKARASHRAQARPKEIAS
ncbi:hypothetical protein [Nonomuraea basaltis]|uniref:hypothetical protein n=1 Tax=Nonomuraea basaltis TaxID=2495887 RepID=UPI00110C3F66|nr:hypothetical protein [Nonomuraea basaltis]TMR91276.1 hypothetical protein EJK15_50690 [Nonomuraea basaltis]